MNKNYFTTFPGPSCRRNYSLTKFPLLELSYIIYAVNVIIIIILGGVIILPALICLLSLKIFSILFIHCARPNGFDLWIGIIILIVCYAAKASTLAVFSSPVWILFMHTVVIMFTL